MAHFVDLGQADATLVDLDLAYHRVCAAFDDGWLRGLELEPGAEPSFEELPDGVVDIELLGEQTSHCRVINRKFECSIELVEPIEPILDLHFSGTNAGCEVRSKAGGFAVGPESTVT